MQTWFARTFVVLVLLATVRVDTAGAQSADSVVQEAALNPVGRPTDIAGTCTTPRVHPSGVRDLRQGRVVLSFVIDARGRVERDGIEVVSATDSSWVSPAVALARSCRYQPGQLDGRTVRVRTERPFRFYFP